MQPERQAGPTQRWVGQVGLAVAVGIVYFVAAQLSLALLTKPEGVAVFWPAAGVSAGVLIGLGSRARWPVVVGTMAATIAANLSGDRNLWDAVLFAFCDAGEAVLTAWLIGHYFGSDFRLNKLCNVLGLVAAAITGVAVSGIGGAITFKLFHSTTTPILTTWQYWFASDGLGIITVAPLLIELASASRDRPSLSELVEGALAVAALALVSGLAIFLRSELLATVGPVAVLFAPLLWLAARCRPVFVAAAAFIVSLSIVWTTTFGIGYFGNPSLSLVERVLAAQVSILLVTIGALVLAALFSERRENEARLARSNMALQRERENKLMNMKAMAASISHEVRQPLSAISASGGAALRFLKQLPPNLEEVETALNRMVRDSHRADEVFNSIGSLFRGSDQGMQPKDMNEIVLRVLSDLRPQLNDHGVVVRTDLASDLPLIMGHRGQIQEVIANLVQNAIDAMDTMKEGDRVLEIETQRDGGDAITVAVRDTGPGIDPESLEDVFDAFVTTKPQGMGLGLAICRAIVERHGGQLSGWSDRKRRGALFQFTLPIKPVASGAAPV